MAKIAFQGPEDLRILNADDLKKSDVDGFKKTTFKRDEATEVDANVAAALLKNATLYGKFEEISSDTELPEADEPLTDEDVTAEREVASR